MSATGSRILGVRKRITTSTLMCLPCAVASDAPRSASQSVKRVARPRRPPASVSVDDDWSQLSAFEKYDTPAFAQNRLATIPRTTAALTPS